MARERDECKEFFLRGKFHVIGGYCTDARHVREERRSLGFCQLAVGQCRGGFPGSQHVPEDLRGRWTPDGTVAKMPAEIRHIAYMTTWEGKLLVIACKSFGEAYVAYMLGLKSRMWRKVVAAEEFCGHVQSSCCLEI
uniref:F-box/kelch-repeat protein n=1 Tax=Vitis vinifera TaxID=29760 RepID=A5B420_VITVI|nr:hypothetical protein VITISV_019821 [Vitis vinifera]